MTGFELAFYDVTDLSVNHYNMGTTSLSEMCKVLIKILHSLLNRSMKVIMVWSGFIAYQPL